MTVKTLTIITVCYNEPELKKTCESIINQTWQDFEWVVIDGASNQETQEIWNKYKSRIDKFISEPDSGVYNAMNKGINIATGNYLLFLNAGDYLYENEVLENIFKDKFYNSDILYGNENLIIEENPTYIDYLPKKITKTFLYFSTVRHQAAFIKKDLFKKYGLYDENYRIVSDYEKWFVFLRNKSKFEYIPYVVSSVNTYGISTNPETIEIGKSERNDVVKKNYTKKELMYFEDMLNFRYKTFVEKIFSIKNQLSNNKFYIIITILGVKIKLKTSDLNNNSKNQAKI